MLATLHQLRTALQDYHMHLCTGRLSSPVLMRSRMQWTSQCSMCQRLGSTFPTGLISFPPPLSPHPGVEYHTVRDQPCIHMPGPLYRYSQIVVLYAEWSICVCIPLCWSCWSVVGDVQSYVWSMNSILPGCYFSTYGCSITILVR